MTHFLCVPLIRFFGTFSMLWSTFFCIGNTKETFCCNYFEVDPLFVANVLYYMLNFFCKHDITVKDHASVYKIKTAMMVKKMKMKCADTHVNW